MNPVELDSYPEVVCPFERLLPKYFRSSRDVPGTLKAYKSETALNELNRATKKGTGLVNFYKIFWIFHRTQAYRFECSRHCGYN